MRGYAEAVAPKTWFVRERSLVQPKHRLFCFSYAGGGSQAFLGWQALVGDGTEVLAVELPGRGRRHGEPPIDSMERLLEELEPAILPLLDRPFSFFGHSNGAVVAYALALHLKHRFLLVPHGLALSSAKAPHLPREHPPLHSLEDREFLNVLQLYNGTPREVMENEELVRLFLPILKADFRLEETYVPERTDPLGTNVLLCGGLTDPVVSREDVFGWRELFAGDVEFREFDGDHFYLFDRKRELVAAIRTLIGGEYGAARSVWG